MTIPYDSLVNRKAVITGASGGIGQSIARHLAAAGVSVLLHANTRRSAAERLAAEIADNGGSADVVTADLGNIHERDAFVDLCWERCNGIDVWINNAGADVLTGTAAKLSFAEKLETLWRVDVQSTIFLSRAIGERMRSHGGVILNVGWDQAETGMAGDSGEMFAVCKGAIMAFSKSLAKSLAPEVRVNCVAPGWIRTEWGQQSASDYWNERAVREALRGRWGTVEDVARLAVFLVSKEADFITGQIVAVNGGLAGYDQWCPQNSAASDEAT